MILHIINHSEYKQHTINIPDWFAAENGFANQFRSQAEIVRETPRARLVKLVMSGEEHWIPKSISKIIERKEKNIFTF